MDLIMVAFHLAIGNYLSLNPAFCCRPVEHWKMLESQRVFFETRPGRKEFPVLERRGDSTSEQRRASNESTRTIKQVLVSKCSTSVHGDL